jgi:catechol 2,3-dioxygenase-like lactoylglutathione lyase family enzyme
MESQTEQAIPVMLVTDTRKSLQWYRELGFEEGWSHSIGKGFTVLTSVTRGNIRIFLSEYINGIPPRSIVYLMIHKDTAISSTANTNNPEEASEITLHDPDGNRINIRYH